MKFTEADWSGNNTRQYAALYVQLSGRWLRHIMRQRDIERIKRNLQARIRYCSTCQPYDGGEVVWMLGARVGLDELMDEYAVPEELRDEMAEGLTCPSCRRNLDLFDEVGELEAWEVDEERKSRTLWLKRYKKYGEPLLRFEGLLAKYPMLGLQDRLGKKLLAQIAKLKSISIDEQVWHRSQLLRPDEKPTLDRMGPPSNQHHVSEGRFNHQGQPLFYLADKPEHAVLETVEDYLPPDRECWVQGFRISRMRSILSLRREDYDEESEDEVALLATALVISGQLKQRVDHTVGWKPAYLLPRFIADCARKAGFLGIISESSRHLGNNLVLFNGMDGVVGEGPPVRFTTVPKHEDPFLAEFPF